MVQVPIPITLYSTLKTFTMSESVSLSNFVAAVAALILLPVLTPYLGRLKLRKEKNLLSGPDESDNEPEEVRRPKSPVV
jgi:hypothetical protein